MDLLFFMVRTHIALSYESPSLLCLYALQYVKLKQADADRTLKLLTMKVEENGIEDLFDGEYFYLVGYSRELLLFSTNLLKMPTDVLEAYDTTCRVLGSLLEKVKIKLLPCLSTCLRYTHI